MFCLHAYVCTMCMPFVSIGPGFMGGCESLFECLDSNLKPQQEHKYSLPLSHLLSSKTYSYMPNIFNLECHIEDLKLILLESFS